MLRGETIAVLVFMLVGLVNCQHAPQPGYTEQPLVVEQRKELVNHLVNLLPESRRSAAALQEATWLADTAYKGAAAIARYNDPVFVNWLNNRAVNTRHHYRHRGLCWHYQHDLYRELRRRPLKYFCLGCCVRDRGRGSEHHVVYIMPRDGQWPNLVMLDAWWYAGRLKVDDSSEIEEWEDDPKTTRMLNAIYREGHSLPLEHWAMVRVGTRYNDYAYSNSEAAKNSPQWRYMQEQMKAGMKRRGGKPVDY